MHARAHARARTRLIQNAIATSPYSFGDLQAYYRRGSSLFALGKFGEAFRDFRKVRCRHLELPTKREHER
jgi:hypothetical protein